MTSLSLLGGLPLVTGLPACAKTAVDTCCVAMAWSVRRIIMEILHKLEIDLRPLIVHGNFVTENASVIS